MRGREKEDMKQKGRESGEMSSSLDLASGSSSRSERVGWRKERTVGKFGPLFLS